MIYLWASVLLVIVPITHSCSRRIVQGQIWHLAEEQGSHPLHEILRSDEQDDVRLARGLNDNRFISRMIQRQPANFKMIMALARLCYEKIAYGKGTSFVIAG